MMTTAVLESFPSTPAKAQTQTESGKKACESFSDILGGAVFRGDAKDTRPQLKEDAQAGRSEDKQADAVTVSVMGSMLVSMSAASPEASQADVQGPQTGAQTPQALAQGSQTEAQALTRGSQTEAQALTRGSQTEAQALTRVSQTEAQAGVQASQAESGTYAAMQAAASVQPGESTVSPESECATQTFPMIQDTQELPAVDTQEPTPAQVLPAMNTQSLEAAPAQSTVRTQAVFESAASSPAAGSAYISGEFTQAQGGVAASEAAAQQGVELIGQSARPAATKESREADAAKPADGPLPDTGLPGQASPVAKKPAGGNEEQTGLFQKQENSAADGAAKKTDGSGKSEQVSVLKNEGTPIQGQGVQTALSAVTAAADEQSAQGDGKAAQSPQTAIAQVTQKISQAIGEGRSSFKMKLNPEGLGQVDVTLTCEKGKISLEILASVFSTKQLLEGQASELKAALGAKNFELTRMDVQAETSTGYSLNSFSGQTTNGNSAGHQAQKAYPLYAEQQDAQAESTYACGQPVFSGRLNCIA